MINKDFKIIFFNGGFAGDLITALYNPDVFKGFHKNTTVLDKEVLKLKSYEFMQTSYDEKIQYVKSIEVTGVCSSHDLKFSLRLKDNTILLYCSDYKLANFFHSRLKRDKPYMKLSFDEHIEWQTKSRQIFKRQVDLADLNKPYFLENLKITDSRSANILTQWLELNKYE